MRCQSCKKNWAVTGFVACRLCRHHAAGVGKKRGASIEARLWGRLRVVGECWEWEGPLTASGYAGGIMHHGRKELAYRWALILTVGDPPIGHEADHYCHNTKCCRPKHLGWVTPEQNNGIRVRQTQDARRRKYNAYQRQYQQGRRAAGLAAGKVRARNGAWVPPRSVAELGAIVAAAMDRAGAVSPPPLSLIE